MQCLYHIIVFDISKVYMIVLIQYSAVNMYHIKIVPKVKLRHWCPSLYNGNRMVEDFLARLIKFAIKPSVHVCGYVEVMKFVRL